MSDTLTKVWGTHTVKAGFFYEWIRNAQPANNNTNGYMQFVPSDNPNFHLRRTPMPTCWQATCRRLHQSRISIA